MRTLLLLALSLPLAGCFSVTAPKPVPEWAMNRQSAAAQGDAQPQRSAAVRQRVRPATPDETTQLPPAEGYAAASSGARMTDAAPNGARPTNTQSAGLGKAVVRSKPTALPKDATAATSTVAEPDWHAHDGEVAHTLNSICRGC